MTGDIPARRAQAEATGLAVIACENLAPYLDADGADATTQADLDLACLQPIPPTGEMGIEALEIGFGEPDGVLTFDDVAPLDLLDNNRIPADCTFDAVVVDQTMPAAGCVLLIFVFVDDEAPVTLDSDAGLASIESGGASDFTCNIDGELAGHDYDCSDASVLDGDGVVVFHVLNASFADGASPLVRAVQEAVEVATTINISDEFRFDEDADSDGISFASDNCPFHNNPAQTNTDGDPLSTPGVVIADATRPMSDAVGDVCDFDDDNDGFPDEVEVELRPFDLYHLLCLQATEDTNPLLADTDGDLFIDFAECILDANPLDPSARPAPPAVDSDGDGLDDTFEDGEDFSSLDPDTDDDGLNDGLEYMKYATSPLTADTDGDGCDDAREAASLDANTTVNSQDLFIVANNFAQPSRPNIDTTKNGAINSGDLLLVAGRFVPVPCGG
jgi:hypothetical protein